MARLALRRRSDALLVAVDLPLGLLACWLAYVLRFEGELRLPSHFWHIYLYASFGTSVGWVASGRVSGLYRRSALRPGTSVTQAAFEAAFAVGVALLIVDSAALSGDLSRAWIGLVVLLLLLFGIGSRWLLAHGRRALVPLGIGLERYAIVGEGDLTRRLVRDMTRAMGAPFRIVAELPPDLGPVELGRRAKELRLEGLVFSPESQPEHVAALAAELAGADMDVLLAPRVGQLDLRVASVLTMQGVPLLKLAGVVPRRRAVRQKPRRLLPEGVAIMGTRGIPARYGGFETLAERLALHLVERTIPVTVYCRRHRTLQARSWRGVRLVNLPTLRSKYFETVLHTWLSAIHLVVRTRIRSVVLCNAANASVVPFLRAAGCRVLLNVDGLEWRRGKWGIAGRAWYRAGEWLSVRTASTLITDAEEVRTYYRVRHDTDSVMVPYGADLLARRMPLPAEYGLCPDNYALYVSRWEPENNPLMVAEAHAAAAVAMRLVMLGEATYDPGFEAAVRRAAAANVLLPGPVFGEAYRALLSNARCYIHATEVGGTHPALIEAMGAGNLCLVLDTPENREVAGSEAWYFADGFELVALLSAVDQLSADRVSALGEGSRGRAARLFSWESVGDTYLRLLAGHAYGDGGRLSTAER